MRNYLIIIIFLLVGSVLHAQEFDTQQQALKNIDRILQRSDLVQEAVARGKERTLLCSRCHGENGNSVRAGTPNLAGQNVVYILKQVMKFANGSRVDFVMNDLAKNLTLNDQVNVALFYANAKVVPQDVDLLLSDRGEDLFEQNCRHCHGNNGRGSELIPRIAGQKIKYLTATITRFHIKNTQQPIRRSLTMEDVTLGLSDEQIHAVANYVAQIE